MKPDWAMVWVVGVLAALGGAVVMREVKDAGRYQLAPMSSGVVARLDTRTGEVTGCRSDRDAWPRFDCAAPMASR